MATQIQEVAMYVRDHVLLAELVRLERKEQDATRSKRLRIIILAMQAWTAPAIAMSVGLPRRDCQEWVRRYNESALPGLEDQHSGGRPATLTPQQQEQFCQRLDAGPTPEDQVGSLRGADLQAILAREFGVLRSLPAVYHLLHRLGYSYLRPRPHHHKADPPAQVALPQEPLLVESSLRGLRRVGGSGDRRLADCGPKLLP
jgi:transposase